MLADRLQIRAARTKWSSGAVLQRNAKLVSKCRRRLAAREICLQRYADGKWTLG
jgi:hypothetical protein